MPNIDLSKIDLSHVDIYSQNYSENYWRDAEYRFSVQHAAKQGAPVQFRIYGNDNWCSCKDPSWNWDQQIYRIDPATKPRKMVPWDRPEDVPMHCWVRYIDGKNIWPIYLVTSIHLDGIHMDGEPMGFPALRDYQFSTDGKTWAKCEKEAT